MNMRTLRALVALAVALGAGVCVLIAIRWLTPKPPRPPAREEVSVTIVEGTTIDDLAHQLQREFGVSVTATRELIGMSADRKSFDAGYRLTYSFLQDLPRTRSLEGYLFPDTYRVWKDELPTALIDKQLTTLRKKVDRLDRGRITRMDDIVTLASIVEREVKAPADMVHVACVFMNRLDIGMPLQSDATLEYVTQSKRARASTNDLALENAYNTYKHKGLPPGPISLPGQAALQAVMDAASQKIACDELYFLTDKQGHVLYARTFEEHRRNRVRAGM